VADTVEGICNAALDLIGYKRHIGSVWEGTIAARVALNAFASTRDEVLAARPWPFTRAIVPLVQTSASAPPPWSYTYDYPNQAIAVLDVYGAVSDLDPKPSRWMPVYIGAARAILTDFALAQATITDRALNIPEWPADFALAVTARLASRMERALTEGQGNAASGRGEQRAAASGG
jgi:hypothetical protein